MQAAPADNSPDSGPHTAMTSEQRFSSSPSFSADGSANSGGHPSNASQQRVTPPHSLGPSPFHPHHHHQTTANVVYPYSAFVTGGPPSSVPAAASYTWGPASGGGLLVNMGPVRKLDEEHTVFRQRPVTAASGEYCANSFIGWHQKLNASRWSLADIGNGGGGCYAMPSSQPQPYQMAHAQPLAYPQSVYDGTNSNASSSFNQMATGGTLMRNGGGGFHQVHPQQYVDSRPEQDREGVSNADGSGGGCGIAASRNWTICLCTMVLIVIIGILVAMTVTVLSQVKTHNSVIKLVRQYRGKFLVTDGSLLNFEPKLLDENSNSFQLHARRFEERLDEMFRLSGLQSIYEGSEVKSFRFIVEVPGLEVNFHLKTKVEVELTARDLLVVLNEGLRNSFPDAIVDLRSLTVENQTL